MSFYRHRNALGRCRIVQERPLLTCHWSSVMQNNSKQITTSLPVVHEGLLKKWMVSLHPAYPGAFSLKQAGCSSWCLKNSTNSCCMQLQICIHKEYCVFSQFVNLSLSLLWSLQNSGFMMSIWSCATQAGVECIVFCYRVTDERLLVSCCSHVAEWLVGAEDGDSTIVTVPYGMYLSRQVLLIEWPRLAIKVKVKVPCFCDDEEYEGCSSLICHELIALYYTESVIYWSQTLLSDNQDSTYLVDHGLC